MRVVRTLVISALLVAGPALAAPPAPAPASGQALPVTARIERLERLLDSQMLVDMMSRLERQQREIQELRGRLEEQTHTIDVLMRRQRELYQDTDRRLLRLEREAPLGSTEVQMTPAPGAVSPPAVEQPVSSSVTPAEPAEPEIDPAQERQAYQAAFDLLKELRYEPAITAFKAFLQKYPSGRYGHVAQYWLGEANYAQRNYQQAISEYQALIDNYPNSAKLAEAMLKIGYSHFELGSKDEARKVLQQLLQRYPETTEAGQATALLKQLKSG